VLVTETLCHTCNPVAEHDPGFATVDIIATVTLELDLVDYRRTQLGLVCPEFFSDFVLLTVLQNSADTIIFTNDH
jgi:hypothetical protein